MDDEVYLIMDGELRPNQPLFTRIVERPTHNDAEPGEKVEYVLVGEDGLRVFMRAGDGGPVMTQWYKHPVADGEEYHYRVWDGWRHVSVRKVEYDHNGAAHTCDEYAWDDNGSRRKYLLCPEIGFVRREVRLGSHHLESWLIDTSESRHDRPS